MAVRRGNSGVLHVVRPTKQRYEAVSANCKKRERVLKNGPPSLIDVHAQHDIIELKDGEIRVELKFAAI